MAKLNYYVLAYSLLAIIIVFSTLNFLYRSERIFASVIVLILFVLIFVFFGLRWFKTGVLIAADHQGNWPPVINSCPDYLTLYKKSDGNLSCIDIIGISSKTNLLRWKNPPPPITDKAYYFDDYYKPSDTIQRLNTLRDIANNAGLTWEGVTDGNYTLMDLTSTPKPPACTSSNV